MPWSLAWRAEELEGQGSHEEEKQEDEGVRGEEGSSVVDKDLSARQTSQLTALSGG